MLKSISSYFFSASPPALPTDERAAWAAVERCLPERPSRFAPLWAAFDIPYPDPPIRDAETLAQLAVSPAGQRIILKQLRNASTLTDTERSELILALQASIDSPLVYASVCRCLARQTQSYNRTAWAALEVIVHAPDKCRVLHKLCSIATDLRFAADTRDRAIALMREIARHEDVLQEIAQTLAAMDWDREGVRANLLLHTAWHAATVDGLTYLINHIVTRTNERQSRTRQDLLRVAIANYIARPTTMQYLVQLYDSHQEASWLGSHLLDIFAENLNHPEARRRLIDFQQQRERTHPSDNRCLRILCQASHHPDVGMMLLQLLRDGGTFARSRSHLILPALTRAADHAQLRQALVQWAKECEWDEAILGSAYNILKLYAHTPEIYTPAVEAFWLFQRKIFRACPDSLTCLIAHAASDIGARAAMANFFILENWPSRIAEKIHQLLGFVADPSLQRAAFTPAMKVQIFATLFANEEYTLRRKFRLNSTHLREVRRSAEANGIAHVYLKLATPLSASDKKRAVFAITEALFAPKHYTKVSHITHAQPFRCVLCSEDKAPHHRITLVCCKDNEQKPLCIGCAHETVTKSESVHVRNKCPCGCGELLAIQDLEALRLSNQEIEQLGSRITHARLSQLPHWNDCLNPNCCGGASTQKIDATTKCMVCNFPLDSNVSPQDLRRLLEGFLPRHKRMAGIMRELYCCGMPFEKGEACLHMHCPTCGGQSHFDKGPWTGSGYFADGANNGAQSYRPLKDGPLGKLGFYEGIPHGPLSESDYRILEARARRMLSELQSA